MHSIVRDAMDVVPYASLKTRPTRPVHWRNRAETRRRRSNEIETLPPAEAAQIFRQQQADAETRRFWTERSLGWTCKKAHTGRV